MRIGDRYQHTMENDIWEYIGPAAGYWVHPHLAICIDGGSIGLTVGNILDLNFNLKHWKFVGNFNKQSNFEQLYDLLNG